MKEFSAIRKAARSKRDTAIKRARDEYAATLKRIAELEQDILGRDPSDHRSMASCITSLIASDRTCTTVDIMAGLEAMDPGKVWRKRSIDNQISILRDTAATEIRSKFGLEAAQVTLGHSNANVTQIYAERDLSKAAEIMRQVG